jgi:hypothetical protein
VLAAIAGSLMWAVIGGVLVRSDGRWVEAAILAGILVGVVVAVYVGAILYPDVFGRVIRKQTTPQESDPGSSSRSRSHRRPRLWPQVRAWFASRNAPTEGATSCAISRSLTVVRNEQQRRKGRKSTP